MAPGARLLIVDRVAPKHVEPDPRAAGELLFDQPPVDRLLGAPALRRSERRLPAAVCVLRFAQLRLNDVARASLLATGRRGWLGSGGDVGPADEARGLPNGGIGL